MMADTKKADSLSRAKLALLERLRRGDGIVDDHDGPTIERLGNTTAPLSFAQQRLWFLHELDPQSTAYNMPVAMRLIGELRIEALQSAVDEVVIRHEALRTTFQSTGGDPMQVISGESHVDISVLELGSETELLERIATLVSEPFDLSEGPLLRVHLIKLAEAEHVLLMMMHHIVSDGWSMSILFRELASFYEAHIDNRESNLPELPVQYADFAIWQRTKLGDGALERHLDYWRQQLADAPAMLELPTDRPRPPIQTNRGASVSHRLPQGLVADLEITRRETKSTLFMVMLAAFKVLLFRWTGQHDIVVGTPTAGRQLTEIEGLIGFFVNTLALRTEFSNHFRFIDLLNVVKESALTAYEHQDMPFEKLVDELNPMRDPSYSPVFQVMFALQQEQMLERLELSGIRVKPESFKSASTVSDLMVQILEDGDRWVVNAQFNTDLFDVETIERMLKQYVLLLKGIASNPEQGISELPMLDDTERETVIREWNTTVTDYPRDATVVDLFEQQVDLSPDSVAVVFQADQITYRELNERSNQLASYLKQIGIGAEMFVGLCLERSIQQIICVLGILKAGGAYVPLDAEYPKARLKFMLEDSGSPVVLTASNLVSRFPERVGRMICIDKVARDIEKQPADNPLTEVAADSLAYMIYTSGSTGEPKGACVEHRNIVSLVRGTDFVEWGPDQRTLAMAPISFDASTYELWGPLLNGGRCVLYPERIPNALQVGELIREQQITDIFLTTALFNTFLDTEPKALKPLNTLMTGGEAHSIAHIRKAIAELPETRLVHVYGPTETTTFATAYLVPKALPENSQRIPIGRPLANKNTYILDGHGQPVPIGIIGELYIGGEGVARGYHERPKLTAQRFLPDLFSDRPGARMYRTGDLVRWLADGSIEFLGREDDQVKVRGFRIELGEIQTVLSTLLGVRQSVVIVREDEPGEKKLVAYVVPAQEQIDAGKLKSELQKRLPEHMVPAAIILLDELPVTRNGKVNRKLLPKPAAVRRASEDARRPMSQIELQLAAIFEQVLKIEGIRLHDNFFDLGGNSILAVRLFHQLRRITGRQLPLSTLFQAPTIASLASLVESDGWEPSWDSLVAVQPNGENRPLFLVPGVGGNVLTFVHLARLLDRNQPLYGFQSRGLDGKQQPFTSIEEIASAYIQDMKKVQPSGPYLLGGACMGAVVAYEMAQQLVQAGDAIALLTLIEPGAPRWLKQERDFKLRTVFEPVVFLWRSGWRHFKAMLNQPVSGWPAYIRARTDSIVEMIQDKDVYRGDRSVRYNDRVSRANIAAMAQYVAEPYSGVTELIIASERPIDPKNDPRMDWALLSKGGCSVHYIGAGDSGQLLGDEHVAELSTFLNSAIENAHATVGNLD